MKDKKIKLNEEILDEDYDPEFDAIWGDCKTEVRCTLEEFHEKMRKTIELVKRREAEDEDL